MPDIHDITGMTIDEISIVDDPANEHARAVIVKRKAGQTEAEIAAAVLKALKEIDPELVDAIVKGDSTAAATAVSAMKEHSMDMEELAKALEAAEARLDELEKRAGDAEAQVAERDEVIKAKDGEIAELKKAAEAAASEGDQTPNEEEIIKSLPESIRKRLEAAAEAEAELAKAREKAANDEAIAKAKAMGFAAKEADEIGPLLARVAKGATTEADAKALETLLKAMQAQTVTGALFKAAGTPAAVDGDPDAILKAKAEDIRKAKPALTFEQAYAEAVEANPDVYNAYVVAKRHAKAA